VAFLGNLKSAREIDYKPNKHFDFDFGLMIVL